MLCNAWAIKQGRPASLAWREFSKQGNGSSLQTSRGLLQESRRWFNSHPPTPTCLPRGKCALGQENSPPLGKTELLQIRGESACLPKKGRELQVVPPTRRPSLLVEPRILWAASVGSWKTSGRGTGLQTGRGCSLGLFPANLLAGSGFPHGMALVGRGRFSGHLFPGQRGPQTHPPPHVWFSSRCL